MKNTIGFYKYYSHGKCESKTIPEIVELIRKGNSFKIGEKIKSIRAQVQKGNIEAANTLKKKLPVFLPTGICNGARKGENFISSSYTGIIILDIDDVEENKLKTLFSTASKIAYTFLAFVSPKGKGLKILVRVDVPVVHHKIAYSQIVKFYHRRLGVEVDSGPDVVRLCFLSHDPNLYYNPNCKIYYTKPIMDIKHVIEFTENVLTFGNGGRNNFIYLLSCNLNKAGILQSEVQETLLEKYEEEDFSEDEITKIIESAYKNKGEHAKYKFEKKLETTIELKDADYELCEQEVKQAGLGYCVDTIISLVCLASKEEEFAFVIDLLCEEVNLYLYGDENCSKVRFIKTICKAYQINPSKVIAEESIATEVAALIEAKECVGLETVKHNDTLIRHVIMEFKQAKLQVAFEKLLHQSPFITKEHVGQHTKVLDAMSSLNEEWEKVNCALITKYLDKERG